MNKRRIRTAYHRQWQSENPEKLKVYQRRWAVNHPDKVRSKAQRHAAKQAALLIRFKRRKGCFECGLHDIRVLQFDHVGRKNFTVTQHLSNCSLKTILAEIQKCDVVCGNCHLRRTWKLRQKERKEARPWQS